MAIFSVGGTHDGNEALLTYNEGGTVSGFPVAAVLDAEEALRDLEREGGIGGTPTGPFYEPSDDRAVLLALLSVLGPPFDLPVEPVLPEQEDEILG